MQTKCSVVLDQQLSDYHFGETHPFGPARFEAFANEFKKRGLENKVNLLPAKNCTIDQLALFHTEEYINKVIEQSAKGEGYLDYGDTPARKGIYEAACVVVGSTLNAIDEIMQGNCQHAFSPIAGLHHARRDQAAGFCVFNDCGIAIEYLRSHYKLNRVAYIDIDAHHGDGVFYSFESDPDLCFVDLHQDGTTLYPGTGFINESGKGIAAGTKMNIPLPAGTTDELAKKFWTAAESFIMKSQPEFILLQCGADSLSGDPITQLELSSRFHAYVTERLVTIAKDYCDGRLMAMGGGGYNLENIAVGWNDVVEVLI